MLKLFATFLHCHGFGGRGNVRQQMLGQYKICKLFKSHLKFASYQAFNDSKSPLLRALTGQLWTLWLGEAAAYNWNVLSVPGTGYYSIAQLLGLMILNYNFKRVTR